MTEAAAPYPGHGTKSYRAYILGVLLVVYTFNFIDRILIGIVQEPLREEFGVSNFALGLLGGPVFALLYTLLGIPIARLAESANRVNIVALGAAVWSAMTALCGSVTSFWQLILCRIGVGIGEAACVPPSHSIIADYFPADRRASALSIFSLGIPIGTSLAYLAGGWVVGTFDWRATFWILGAPGLIAAAILKFTVKDPPRAHVTEAPPTIRATIAALLKKPSFVHIALGGALISFVGYGSSQFLVSHLIRNYDLGATLAHEAATASYAMAAIGGLSAGLGTFLGGAMADRLSTRHARVLSWLPALGVGLAIPFYAISFMQSSFAWAIAFLLIAPIFHYLYLGPMFAATQAVAPKGARATSTAILLLVVNMIGYGLGPPFVGAANDFFAGQILAASNSGLTLADCDPRTIAGANAALCAQAQASGLKYALGAAILFLGWAGVHFLLAGRTLLKDRAS